MFCPHCGNALAFSARYCPGCGAPYAAVPPPGAVGSGQLFRPRHPRAIAGVCAAFALAYGWDLTLVRVVTVLIVLFTGVGILAYIAAWIFIPEEPYLLTNGTPS